VATVGAGVPFVLAFLAKLFIGASPITVQTVALLLCSLSTLYSATSTVKTAGGFNYIVAKLKGATSKPERIHELPKKVPVLPSSLPNNAWGSNSYLAKTTHLNFKKRAGVQSIDFLVARTTNKLSANSVSYFSSFYSSKLSQHRDQRDPEECSRILGQA
jgi:hypothetical protein